MRLLALVEAAFALALAGAAAKERLAGAGVESGLLALGVALAPLHVRRLLALAGRTPPPAAALSLLEGAALAGALASYPAPAWSVALGLAVAVTLASGGEDAPARPPLGALAGAALAALLGAAAFVALGLAQGAEWSLLRALALAPALLEALAPGRARSDRDSLRRLAAAGASAAAASPAAGTAPRLLAMLFAGAVALVHLASARRGQDRARARRLWTLRALAAAAPLALLLVLAEGALHAFPNRYRDLVAEPPRSWHAPGELYVYEGAALGPRQAATNAFRWNAGGWHDRDHARARPEGTTRILVLGDSYVEAVQMPEDALYHVQLERALGAPGEPPVEAIALAASGWGQGQECLALEREGLAYDPQLAIAEFLPANDIRNNDDVLEALANEEALHATRARELFLQALQARLLVAALLCDELDLFCRRLEGQQDSLDADVYRAAPRRRPDRWEASWRTTEERLARMKALLAARGRTLVVAIFTAPPEIEACVPGAPPGPRGLDWRLPARRMQELCARLALPCLDLAPRFARLPEAERRALHMAGDGHWSASGHAAAARETAHFLREETDLWQRALSQGARR